MQVSARVEVSLHTAAMVMLTDVLPYETRARCAVDDFLESEPAVPVRNVQHRD